MFGGTALDTLGVTENRSDTAQASLVLGQQLRLGLFIKTTSLEILDVISLI